MPVQVRAVLDELESTPDVGVMHFRAGQVLVYAGHVPPGLFVVLAGSLDLGGEPIDATCQLVPDLHRLDEPLRADLTAACEAEVIFVPRSCASRGSRLHRLLSALDGAPASGPDGDPPAEIIR